jgi:hypothetical protein
LADLDDAEYSGGFSFIPSSSLKDNIFFADWSNDIVKMMEFGTDGLPLGTVDAPQISNFITLADGQVSRGFRPWGFFFDSIVSFSLYLHLHLLLSLTNHVCLSMLSTTPTPTQTNDFFVSTWGRTGGEGIFHFRGFAPGLSIPVVTANIEYEMNQALDILFSADANRKLGQDASAQVQLKYLRGRRYLGNKGQGEDHRADPCNKANPNAAHGLEMAGKNCKKEIVIPPAEESE